MGKKSHFQTILNSESNLICNLNYIPKQVIYTDKTHPKIQRSKNIIFNKAGEIPMHLSNFQCAIIAYWEREHAVLLFWQWTKYDFMSTVKSISKSSKYILS